jgi:hypothetical protein
VVVSEVTIYPFWYFSSYIDTSFIQGTVPSSPSLSSDGSGLGAGCAATDAEDGGVSVNENAERDRHTTRHELKRR